MQITFSSHDKQKRSSFIEASIISVILETKIGFQAKASVSHSWMLCKFEYSFQFLVAKIEYLRFHEQVFILCSALLNGKGYQWAQVLLCKNYQAIVLAVINQSNSGVSLMIYISWEYASSCSLLYLCINSRACVLSIPLGLSKCQRLLMMQKKTLQTEKVTVCWTSAKKFQTVEKCIGKEKKRLDAKNTKFNFDLFHIKEHKDFN